MGAGLLDLDDAESDDVLDDTEAEESPEERWARIRAERADRYWRRNRVIGRASDHDPWVTANGPDRRLAQAVAVRLVENPGLEHGELAALLGVAEHEVRGAIHLLVSAGLLIQARGKWVIREAVNT